MKITENFSETKVLIIGDVMLDRYWWGSVSRISPEAPVPVVNLEKTSLVVGGAANVAANVAGLGAQPFLVGLIGNDDEADLLVGALTDKKINTEYLIKSPARQTTVKTRVIAHSQQVTRIDQESKIPLSSQEEKKLWEKIIVLLDIIKIIIVSDYGKGTVSEELVKRLITTATEKKILVLIDPKGKYYDKYKGATMLTPNRYELAEAYQLEDYDQQTIETAGKKLLSALSLESLLVTQGEAGMTLFERNESTSHLPVTARKVYDVTGAGDTVIACLAVAIGSGVSFLEAAKFANQAAGLVVEQVGTTAVSLSMLDSAQSNEFEQ